MNIYVRIQQKKFKLLKISFTKIREQIYFNYIWF